MSRPRLLLTSVFGPYGIKTKYAEGLGMQIELLNNQITREQGVHSPRQSYWSFGLYMLAENISTPTTVLDFPTWSDFKRELKNGYSHVGISFIVPNVLKAKRMAEYIRRHHPEIKIILGGYGTIIPDLQHIVPHDDICPGEGVRWLREYFGDDPYAPVRHPAVMGPAFEYIYGYKGKPKGAILMPGLGCNNGCTFCITSHKFNKQYIPLLPTGRDVFDACRHTEAEIGSRGFSIMDENFLKMPKRARELLEEMTHRKKPYVFDIFSSAEVIREVGVDFLVRLGVRMVWIGVESRSNGHAKTKGIDLHALFRELQSKGIVVNASMILFQDHHDEKNMREDIDWVIGLGADLTQFMNYTPYPTTDLYQRLEKENRLKHIDYRHQHGAGELAFSHPYFNDPKTHIRYLKNAFRKKYRSDGPGALNMARTAVKGYETVSGQWRANQEAGKCWDPETLCYQKNGRAPRDEFMELRLGKMKRIAMNMRPVLLPALVFAPNMAARKKALDAMRLYRSALGRQSSGDMVKGIMLVATGAVESVRIRMNRMIFNRDIIRQPPSRRTEFNSAELHVVQ